MALVRLQNISVGFGGPALLDGVELNLERGERVCLVGRNGEGKSTLLRIIDGSLAADSGEVSRRQGIGIAQLEQDVPRDLTGCLRSISLAALDEVGGLLDEYHRAVENGELEKIDSLHSRIDALDGWNAELRVETVLSRLQLDGAAKFETLSGGMKRRALLARALVGQPDILLLDEPTNHLDIDTIVWLEKFLLEFVGTLLFITHDRAFLRHLATRIVEIDRGRVTSWPGDYDRYLVNKQALLDAEEIHNSEFDKKLAREEVWIRQGIKARRTRNEGRIRSLEKMRGERAQRRNRVGTATINALQAGKSGKIVFAVKNISYSIAGNNLIDNFSATIMRGDKIGIIGDGFPRFVRDYEGFRGAGEEILRHVLPVLRILASLQLRKCRHPQDTGELAADMVKGGHEYKPLPFHTHGGLDKIVRFVEIDECSRLAARPRHFVFIPVRVAMVRPAVDDMDFGFRDLTDRVPQLP